MSFTEINFDGLIGPSHNYGGLSLGNLASAANAGSTACPRQAALQGLEKMRRLMELGLMQGFIPPLPRPDIGFLLSMGFSGADEAICAAAWRTDPALLRNAMSASSMWTANAATVSPAPDTADGRCHLTVANLSSMAHRSIEPEDTLHLLGCIFRDERSFAVHPPVPTYFGDEGAANHMRMTSEHGAPGIELFVYGERTSGTFPARQNRRASEAVARLHDLAPVRTFFTRQSEAAIDAGAFHNDVVAVANEHVLFAHEQAFEDKASLYAFITESLPSAVIVEVPASRVSLEEAIRSYLFNSQLVSLPEGGMALVVPSETQESEPVRKWLDEFITGNNLVHRLEVLDVRESMRNGGGPACLRLRVVVDEIALAAIDQRFVLNEAKWGALHAIVERHWPERIAPDDLGLPETWRACRAARDALFRHLALES